MILLKIDVYFFLIIKGVPKWADIANSLYKNFTIFKVNFYNIRVFFDSVPFHHLTSMVTDIANKNLYFDLSATKVSVNLKYQFSLDNPLDVYFLKLVVQIRNSREMRRKHLITKLEEGWKTFIKSGFRYNRFSDSIHNYINKLKHIFL